MIHPTKYKGLFFFSLVLLLVTCKKKEIYSTIPLIEYKSASFYQSSSGADSIMLLTFTFKDGDGDIGLDQSDTLFPFQADRNRYNKATNPFHYNLNIDYYELIDNKYSLILQELEPDSVPPIYDTLKYNFRIENITPEGRHKAIRGDIEVQIYPNPQPFAKDTVKYKFYIYDRALNQSNTVETPALVWKRR
jgi:hypothetical protein